MTLDELRSALAWLPDLSVSEVSAGLAISSSAWIKRDGDLCGAFASQIDRGWIVSDAGDILTFLSVEQVAPVAAAAGANMVQGDIIIGKLTRRMVPAAVVQMLALLWRLDREFGK